MFIKMWQVYSWKKIVIRISFENYMVIIEKNMYDKIDNSFWNLVVLLLNLYKVDSITFLNFNIMNFIFIKLKYLKQNIFSTFKVLNLT